jgi:hypothetical protein
MKLNLGRFTMNPGDKLLLCGLMTIFLSVALPAAQGQVQFSGPTDYPVGTAPLAIAIRDFNGDGILDLVVANAGNVAMGDDGSVSRIPDL